MSKSISKSSTTTPELLEALREARDRTLDLVADLDDDELMGPRLRIVNPLRWEIGHVAFFQEFWCLRHFHGLPPLLENGDALYDSARVEHDTRWDLPLPSRQKTLDFMQHALDRVIESNKPATDRSINGYDQKYFLQLALLHEQMHDEAITYTRQTLGYSAPHITGKVPEAGEPRAETRVKGDAYVPGGAFSQGSSSDSDFTFDNELCEHEVDVRPFSISKTAVTEGEFASFVEDRGYLRPECWSEAGWTWRKSVSAEHPVYWRRESSGRWLRRHFDQCVPLRERSAMVHVNWYEADAYCRWAGRRLTGEAEWEMAASCEPSHDGSRISAHKRVYPWGDAPPRPDLANLDWRAMGCLEVDSLPQGDSAFGCRQMIGNCWEWTSDNFSPYPGFVPGPYREYSEPWFSDHKVLRGGCWASRSSLVRNTYRNFYTPDRRDVWAGFRTCAVST